MGAGAAAARGLPMRQETRRTWHLGMNFRFAAPTLALTFRGRVFLPGISDRFACCPQDQVTWTCVYARGLRGVARINRLPHSKVYDD